MKRALVVSALLFASYLHAQTTGTTTGTQTAGGIQVTGAIVVGHCANFATATSIQDAGGVCGTGTNAAFNAITAGTNTTAAMVLGSGSSLTVSGTGTNNANLINGLTFPTLSAGNCLTNNGTTLSWGTCGSGSSAFSAITGSTNTTAAMVIGTGASLTVSGSGSNNATTLGGATFASPGAIGGTTPAAGSFTTLNASGQITSTVSTGTSPFVVASTTVVPNLNAVFLNGATFAQPGPIGSTTPSTGAFTSLSATSKITTAASTTSIAGLNLPHGTAPTSPVDGDLWTTTAGFFGRVNGSTIGPFGVSGGSTAFSAITGSTNTSAAMVCGSGCTFGVSGTGTNTATHLSVLTTLGDVGYQGASAIARLAGPTATNGVPQLLTSIPSGGAAVAPIWSVSGVSPNAQTGTTYTFLATDRANYTTFSNAGSIAVTLPQAGGTGFASNFVTRACTIGAGTATITPTTSTISYTTGSAYTSAASTMTLATGECATIYSDNTNYFANKQTGGSGSGTVTNIATGTGLTGGPITTTGTLSVNAVPLSSMATQAADTVVMNATGGSAAPTAVAMPTTGTNGCSGGANALIYNNSTHVWDCQTGVVTAPSTFASGAIVQSTGANKILTSATGHGVALPLTCPDTSASSTAQVCNTSPTFTPAANDCVNYTTTTANTGAGLTVNVNSLGAKSVAKWQSTTTLAANDVRANVNTRLCYDGTNWEIDTIGNAPGGGSGTVTVVGAGSLTSTALITGGGSQTLQTPSATTTLDGSGNLAVAAGGSVGSADTGTPKFTFATNKATINQPLTFATTTNQIVTGTTTNLTTSNYPASSGAVTLTFPNVTTTIPGLAVANTWTALQTFGANASIAGTAHGVLLSQNTSAATATAVGATNTVLHGNTGADPTYSAIVAADITNATITGTQIASGIALAGSPTTTTQAAGDNSTKVATTAYVDRVPKVRAIAFNFGAPEGSALSTNLVRYMTIPFACTITGWDISADSGTATMKFWKVATGTALPTVSNIISTSGVALSTGTTVRSSTVTDFTTTTVTAGDIIAATNTATSAAKFLQAELECTTQ